MSLRILRSLRFFALFLGLLCLAPCALADCPPSAGDSIPEGRSPVPTCPMISWEEQRARAAAWPAQAVPCSVPSGSVQDGDNAEADEPSPMPDGSYDDGHYTPQDATPQEQSLYQAINEERLANGLEALPLDETLSALAREKSQNMIDNGYFAHESPTYGSAADMLDAAEYEYVSVGENLARSASVEKAHAALMSSANHRRNILGSQWTRVGIGVVNDANGYPYVTELFAR